ncbi:unnamed protein product [Brassica oleracea var. botrytis]|uniref:Uncharacterized protein n=1 Tax=Brassica oleracea TaxID=3712 RepID=A0A3P6EF88_BRAOL|nr:unnamed protein product [Brassica oleracea]
MIVVYANHGQAEKSMLINVQRFHHFEDEIIVMYAVRNRHAMVKVFKLPEVISST